MRLKRFIVTGLFFASFCSIISTSTSLAANSKYAVYDPLSEKNGADYIVVTPGVFLNELEPLLEKRDADGHRVAVVTTEQIHAAFENMPAGATTIRAFIKYAYDLWERPAPKYLLLIGDAPLDENYAPWDPTMPTFMVKIGENWFCASDNPYADMDSDDLPDIAVGRIPADSPEELRGVIAKIIDYETDPEPGLWRRRANSFASTGGFGKGGDSFLEEMGKRLVRNHTSPIMDFTMTYANPTFPYFYVPDEFEQKVLDRFNEGSLITLYVGHGGVRGTAGLQWRGKYYTIMKMDDLKLIDPGRKRPFVFLIACLTGKFDDENESIAEELLNSPTGAVGVYAASVGSHTYSNALLAKDIMYSFTIKRPETIGIGLMYVEHALMKRFDPDRKLIDSQYGVIIKKSKLKKINVNHIHMYNFLGDPATRIAYPAETITVTAPERAAAGDKIPLSLEIPDKSSGKLLITLECEPTEILHETKNIENLEGDELRATIKQNYDNANNHVAAKIETELAAGGKAEFELEIPDWLPPGNYFVKAYLWGGTPDATGFVGIKIQNN